jgi:hypothetical protein
MENMEDCDPIAEMFAERVSNALEWFKHAQSLIAAARATTERAGLLIDVWGRSDLENVATMLYGFALENLFKATWTYKKFGSPHEEGYRPIAAFPKELKTHDLVQLANLIDPELANKYKFSLELLADAATWSGRYPCSIKGDEGSIGRFPHVHEDAETIFKMYCKPFSVCF